MSCVLIYSTFLLSILHGCQLGIKNLAELVSKGTTGGTRRAGVHVKVCVRGEVANGCDIEG